MIQRRQSLWLLLATIAAILSFKFRFVTGKVMIKDMAPDKIIDAGSTLFLLVLTGASVALSTIIIFLFKDRKQQVRLCLLGILLTALLIVLYIMQMKTLIKPTLALSCVLPLAILIGYFMAFRDIRRDEKLIKTLDKLR